jgi:hypothetical protein
MQDAWSAICEKGHKALESWRETRGRLSLVLAMVAFAQAASACILTAYVLYSAWRWGFLLLDGWKAWDMNHGPWWYACLFPGSRLNGLHETLDYTFELLLNACLTSLVSTVLAFTWRRLALFVFCFASFFTSIAFLGWLVD